MGCMVDHNHLDKNTFSILLQKGTICGYLLFNVSNSECVHIYVNKLIKIPRDSNELVFIFLK
jgi:hypothetical protein